MFGTTLIRLATVCTHPQKTRARASHAGAKGAKVDETMASLARLVRRRSLRSFVAAAGIALAGLPTAAMADETGSAGRIVKLVINGEGSDDFASSHGSITVRHSGNKLEQYSWGGTQCPASKLREADVSALHEALHFRSRTLIIPRYKAGEVSLTRCLVGFELQAG